MGALADFYCMNSKGGKASSGDINRDFRSTLMVCVHHNKVLPVTHYDQMVWM